MDSESLTRLGIMDLIGCLTESELFTLRNVIDARIETEKNNKALEAVYQDCLEWGYAVIPKEYTAKNGFHSSYKGCPISILTARVVIGAETEEDLDLRPTILRCDYSKIGWLSCEILQSMPSFEYAHFLVNNPSKNDVEFHENSVTAPVIAAVRVMHLPSFDGDMGGMAFGMESKMSFIYFPDPLDDTMILCYSPVCGLERLRDGLSVPSYEKLSQWVRKSYDDGPVESVRTKRPTNHGDIETEWVLIRRVKREDFVKEKHIFVKKLKKT